MNPRYPLSYLRDVELCRLEEEIERVRGALRTNDPGANLAYQVVMQRIHDFKRKWAIPEDYLTTTPGDSGSSSRVMDRGEESISPLEHAPGPDD